MRCLTSICDQGEVSNHDQGEVSNHDQGEVSELDMSLSLDFIVVIS